MACPPPPKVGGRACHAAPLAHSCRRESSLAARFLGKSKTQRGWRVAAVEVPLPTAAREAALAALRALLWAPAPARARAAARPEKKNIILSAAPPRPSWRPDRLGAGPPPAGA